MSQVYQPKTYHILTLGCQANIADSNKMCGILEALGFEPLTWNHVFQNEVEELTYILNHADLLIVNSCSIRQKSEDKVYGIGKTWKAVKDSGATPAKIILAGCMVGSVTGERARYTFEVLNKKTPWANAYMNPSQILELPKIIRELDLLTEKELKTFDTSGVTSKQPDLSNAFVNISYGCDNFCTYCVVPFSRGKEVHLSSEEILGEVKCLVENGVTGITLCGQNVNSWGLTSEEKFQIRAGSGQKLPFAQLLREIHAIEGLQKISFLSSNPFDFTEDLIEALRLPKIANYLHIAVQSGSNEILKKMNRRHTVDEFVHLVSRIKHVRPDMEIGTDLIVGFCGETEEQFQETVQLVRQIPFNVIFISMYSERVGTRAQREFKDDISLKEKKRRHAYLTKIWKENKPKSRKS